MSANALLDRQYAKVLVREPAHSGRRLGNVDDVAANLGCSPKTVRRLADAGKIPGLVRLGRLVKFDLHVIDQWIEQGCPALHRFVRGGKRG